jgi:hypothetical protein
MIRSGERAASWLFSVTRNRSSLSHQGLEGATLRVGALTGGSETSLRRKELGLSGAARELPLGQHHRCAGDLLSPRNRACVLHRAGRCLQCPTRLLKGAFGVLCVLSHLELAEPVLKLGGLGP